MPPQNQGRFIDLHTHTTASDGSITPGELVKAAAKTGLAAVAVTDHDTTEGLDEALDAGAALDVEVVPGVEISINGGPTGSMHLVGLYLDHHQPHFEQTMTRLQQARAQRNPRIVGKLNELGFAVTMEQIASYSGGGQIGRPHFAQALIDIGAVSNRQEAFNRFLGNGKPAYVAKARLDAPEAIALIRGAGGVPVLAHPGLLKAHPAALERLLAELKGCGLEGVEALYSEHDEITTKRVADMAGRLGLVVSGGSDFHGAPKPDIILGFGLGTLRVPASLLTAIKQRRDKIRATAEGGR